MTNNALDELTSLLREQKSEIPILEYRVKDLQSIVGVILTVIDSGFFVTIMNALDLWSQKHYNATIKISYQSVDNKQIEITYSKLNKKDAEDILTNHPPQVGNKVNMELHQSE